MTAVRHRLRYVIDPAEFDGILFAFDVLTGTEGGPLRQREGVTPASPEVPMTRPAVPLLRSLRGVGIRTATAATRRDVALMLASAGIGELVEVVVDGVDAEVLSGAPDEAVLHEALHRLAIPASRVLFIGGRPRELALARSAGCGHVLGVHHGTAATLLQSGADRVVSELDEVEVAAPLPGMPERQGPDRWSLEFQGFDPSDEARREVLCATGNGYLVTRAAAPESTAGRGHYPGTYLAGVYNRLVSNVHGRTMEHEELVNGPNWLPFTFRIKPADWFTLEGWSLLEHRLRIDIRHGILHRRTRVQDHLGRATLITQRRFVSMHDPHVAALETTLMAENWSGELEVRSGIDGDITNSGVDSYRQLSGRHLEVHHTEAVDPDSIVLVTETIQSGIRIAVAERLRAGATPATSQRVVRSTPTRIDQQLTVHLERGQPARFEKIVGIFTSRDRAISECSLAAKARARRAGSFEELAAEHRSAWERLWARSALWVDIDGQTPTIVNLHRFHLLQSVSPHTARLDAGVTARGLHGEAYRGHVFWDELFVFPLLNFRFPELTRSLLQYRYRRLDEARQRARSAGYEGAMFPWQSAATGREETPSQFFNPRSGRWMADHSSRQRHVSLAIAYNVWTYYQATGDTEFLLHFGAELMIEIARFWASIATWNSSRGRYGIEGVMGPDEFHDGPPDGPGAGLANNAYTNVMASWVLWRTRQLVEMLQARDGNRLFERVDLHPRELERWEHVSTRLYVPFSKDGTIAQFEGYEDLAEFDWSDYRRRYGDIGRLDLILEAERDTTNRYKLAKQADALMLFFMLSAEELGEVLNRLGYHFDPTTIPKMIGYYLERTSNGSTLSRVVHAWVLARSDRRASWRVLLDALEADFNDVQGGTTGEGIHLGAMAGTVDILQRCFVDLDARDGVLHLNPRLPEELPRLRFAIDYRGLRLEVDVTHDGVVIRSRPSTASPVRVAVRDQAFELAGGQVRRVPLKTR